MATIVAGPQGAKGIVHAPRPSALWAIALAGLAAAGCTDPPGADERSHPASPACTPGSQVWGMLGVRPRRRGRLVAAAREPFRPADGRWRAPPGSCRASPRRTSRFPTRSASRSTCSPPSSSYTSSSRSRADGWSGRSSAPSSAVGYVTAFGVHLFGMTLGGFGPDNLLEIVAPGQREPPAARTPSSSSSARCVLTGIGVLAFRRREAGRPLRRSLALLVDSFALALVMIAFLFLSAVFGLVSGETPFETIRRVTFFVVGLAPFVFLVGLLHARLARSAVGDLIVELQADPTPRGSPRRPVARAARPVADARRTGCRSSGRTPASTAGPSSLPAEDSGRAMTLIDRTGCRWQRSCTTRRSRTSPSSSPRSTAAAGIALENARLHVELRARLEELRGSRARMVDVANKERQRLERNLHDGAQQRLVALSLELSLLGGELGGRYGGAGAARPGRGTRSRPRSRSSARSPAGSIPPSSAGTGSGSRSSSSPLWRPVPVRLGGRDRTGGCPRRSRSRRTTSSARASRTSASTPRRRRRRSTSTAQNGSVLVEVTDDGVGGADTERGSGLRGIADRVEALDGRLRIWSPAGGGTRVRAEIPCAP